MKSRIVFTTMAMTSILAVSSLCTGCKSADASTKSNIDSSSMAVTSAVDSVADTSSVAEVKKVEREFTATLEVGKTYTPQEVAALLVAKDGVSVDSSSIDVSSIATSSVTVTESSAVDTAKAVESAEIKFAAGIAQKSYAKIGEQHMTMNAKYPDGSEEVWNITVTVVDSEKPEFLGIKDKYEITEGDKLPDFKNGVSVKDNYDESVEFTAELDDKAKKSDYKAGEYTITYKAKDSSGNEVTTTSKLIIKEKPEKEKKDDEKSEETSDNNNNGNGGNTDNNGGGSSNNNGGGNSNNGGGSSNNGGGNSNNNGGNGGSQNNGGDSSNNNGGGSSNNNGGGNSNNNGGGNSGNDAPYWNYDDGDWGDQPDTSGWVWQHGDPAGLGYEYDYLYNPSTGEWALH